MCYLTGCKIEGIFLALCYYVSYYHYSKYHLPAVIPTIISRRRPRCRPRPCPHPACRLTAKLPRNNRKQMTIFYPRLIAWLSIWNRMKRHMYLISPYLLLSINGQWERQQPHRCRTIWHRRCHTKLDHITSRSMEHNRIINPCHTHIWINSHHIISRWL